MKSAIAPKVRNESFERGNTDGSFLTQTEWILQTFLKLGWASDEDVYFVLRSNTEFMKRYPKFGRQTVPARRNDLFNSVAFLAKYDVRERRGDGDTEYLIRERGHIPVKIEPNGQVVLCL